MSRIVVLFVWIALLPAQTTAQQSTGWTVRTSLIHPRYNFGVTTHEGRVYVFGGTVDAGSGAPATASIEAYDAASDRWVEAGAMTSPRTHAAACSLGGQVFDGVGTVEAYDPATDSWSPAPVLGVPRVALAAAALDGRVYAVGGSERPWPFQPAGAVQAMNPPPPGSAGETAVPDTATIRLPGMEMHYRFAGSGEVLLLLHGFLESGSFFDPYFDGFADQYRVIVPDLRGHGRSTNPDGTFTMRQGAEDIFALLDSLGVDRVRGVGTSTGAMILEHMATQQPNRVEAMVLVGGGTHYPEACRARLAAASPESYAERWWTRMRGLHPRGDEQILELISLFAGFGNDTEDMAFMPSDLSRIQARTLILHGDRDWCFPASMAAEMHEAIPTSYLWVVPNGGHIPIGRVGGEDFISTTLEFLRGWGQ